MSDNAQEVTAAAQAQMMAALAGQPWKDLDQLAPAYVKAWREVGVAVKKDATNPAFRSEYATLEAHLNAIKSVFAANDLAILQAPGELNGDRLTIDTVLLHKSGQRISIRTHVPMGGKSTAQSMGSAATYGARYVLRGIGGLAASDDDGAAASEQTGQSTPTPKRRAPEADAGAVEAMLKTIEDFTGTVEELEKTVRPDVEALGNAKVNKAYVAKRTALKTKKA